MRRLQEMLFVPRASYGRRMLRGDGGPNRDFLAYVFCDFGFAVQFLKDVGLLRSKVQCNTCGRGMTWSAEPSTPEGFRWRYIRKVAGIKCSESRSISTAPGLVYFCLFVHPFSHTCNIGHVRQSNLTFREILLVTYDIVCCEPACRTTVEYSVYHLPQYMFVARC